MDDFKKTLYEAVLVAYGKVLSRHNIFSNPQIMKDVGKEIIDYLNEHGFGFTETNTLKDLNTIKTLFVENGFTESVECIPEGNREKYVWHNLYGFDAYQKLHEVSDNPFLACPLNLALYYITEKHGKTMLLHKKEFDRENDTVTAEYELVDLYRGNEENFTIDKAKLLQITEKKTHILQELAMTDPLTSLLNRRGFLDETQKFMKQSETLSLLIIDVDDFKHINDTYGHPAGDAVLSEIASRCASTLRSSDILGRIGGDEFAICAKIGSSKECIHLANRINSVIRQVPFTVPDQETEIEVTVSIGIAYKHKSRSFEEAFNVADQQLCKAKHDGKNCISVETI